MLLKTKQKRQPNDLQKKEDLQMVCLLGHPVSILSKNVKLCKGQN